ncbi:ATP-binding protein [Candidatus Magnetaquicoccus inordinatus]|uniref:ATP-binding protein n=1 Tax=Candidatus Magnetaquicoccus inordinatus TaxID=2496818 RepID=UPI00102C543C|nr:ATP-binding protein [Candidatus Magnetaquicoccus inordinatus]
MRVARVKLENFKRFKDHEIIIRNTVTEDIAERFLLLGDNGTGKTTILQAIALCLSKISGTIRDTAEFDWQGWVPGRYEKSGVPVVELDICFSDDEIKATQDVSELWYKNNSKYVSGKKWICPGDAKEVTVRLEGGCFSTHHGKLENIFQFRGRSYAAQLLRNGVEEARAYFPRLPGCFWFDQYRNMASPSADPVEQGQKLFAERETEYSSRRNRHYATGVSRLRKHLISWMLSRLMGAPSDWLTELENSYKMIFPGRSFALPEPMFRGGTPTVEDYYFCLQDGNRTYDIEEMSAGEQSVFPMLYEFVRMQISNSIVLIDEIDLNLHPPLAQALLMALPALGAHCQFLLTTHSEAITALVSPGEIYRLEGGRLCL